MAEWFVKVPVGMTGNPTPMAVYYVLVEHRNSKTGRCNVTDKRVADRLELSVSTVARARIKLRDAGWLDWSQTRGANHYRFPRQYPNVNPVTSDRVSDGNPVTSDGTAQSPVTEQPGHPCPKELDVLELDVLNERERVTARSLGWVTRQKAEWPDEGKQLIVDYGEEPFTEALKAIEQEALPKEPRFLWSSELAAAIKRHIGGSRTDEMLADYRNHKPPNRCDTCKGHGQTMANDIVDNSVGYITCPDCDGASATVEQTS